MDHELPPYLGFPAGVGRDDDLPALDDYFFFSHEPPESCCAGTAVAQEALGYRKHPDPQPPPLPTYHAGGNPSGKETPSDAEMASWLCQVFEQEPRGAANAAPSNRGGAGEHPRGRPSSGRRRSCSGKAAEQRRRNKINDKLRTLRQLVPWSSKAKTDKVSTLEEVIKYVKSLQHQVQVMSANGYAVPTPIWPLGVMPPPWMRPPAGDVLGGQSPVMLPQYPVFPVVYACRPHGTPLPLPLSAPCTPRRHPVEPAGSGGGPQRLAPKKDRPDHSEPHR